MPIAFMFLIQHLGDLARAPAASDVSIRSTSGEPSGMLAPAVAVAVEVAVEVEQRLRARRVVVAELGLQRRVVGASCAAAVGACADRAQAVVGVGDDLGASRCRGRSRGAARRCAAL